MNPTFQMYFTIYDLPFTPLSSQCKIYLFRHLFRPIQAQSSYVMLLLDGSHFGTKNRKTTNIFNTTV